MLFRLFADDRGQDMFEYLLVVAVVVVAVIGALWGFDAAVSGLAGHACPAIDTAQQAAGAPAAGSCIN